MGLERFLQTDVGEKAKQITLEAADHYKTLMEEMKYMEKTLPDLLNELRTIQLKVDKRHKNSNIATVSGCVSSIIGGTLIVGGMVAAPFTLGASIGLSAAGTAIAVAGGATTATARTADFLQVDLISKETEEKKVEFLGHYTAAKEAYETVNQTCQELTAILPTFESGNTKGITVALNAIVSVALLINECTRMLR